MGVVVRLDAVRGLKRQHEISVGKVNASGIGACNEQRPAVSRDVIAFPPLANGVLGDTGISRYRSNRGPAICDVSERHARTVQEVRFDGKTLCADSEAIMFDMKPAKPKFPGIEDRLQRLLIASDFRSAAELARELGWKDRTMQAYFSGKRRIQEHDIPVLARALGVTPSFLMTGKEQSHVLLTDEEIALVMAYRDADDLGKVASKRILAQSSGRATGTSTATATAADATDKRKAG